MVVEIPNITLNNGEKMPAFGLGTWRASPGVVGNAVKVAIDEGYRHIDGAFIYLNETEVGKAIKESIDEGKVKREELFVVSKSWGTHRTRERVVIGCKKSLELFGLDYFDLYLIHFPIAFKQCEEVFPKGEDGKLIFDDDIDYLDTWKGMEDLVKMGLVKSIGISNFSIQQTKRILENCEIKPVTNQVECHPYFNRANLVEKSKELGIVITAYSPLATPERTETMSKDVPQLLDHDVLKEIGGKYNKTPAQVALRYQIDRGNVVIPKSSNPNRIKENISIFDFKLTVEEVKKIDGIDIKGQLFNGEDFKKSKYYPYKDDE